MPYPEEMNRRMTGTIASYDFAPTPLSREHLLSENVDDADIVVTGNTVIDAFLLTAAREDLPSPPRWSELDPSRPIVVVTAHRRENHPYMREMCEAMREIASLPARPQIYWPVHPSPHVAPVAHDVLDGTPGVVLVDPIDYARMTAAVRDCTFVLTDSGGLQEEAPTLGKPVLVMRDETERPEGLTAGTLELVGHERAAIVAASVRLLTDQAAYAAHGPRRQSVRRRARRRAHRRLAAGPAAQRAVPQHLSSPREEPDAGARRRRDLRH